MSETFDVLVTGASGFLGGALVRRFEAAGRRVAALVRRRERLSYVPANSTLIVEYDLAAAPPSGVRADAIVHAAAVSPWSGVALDEVIHSNVAGTKNLVRFALESGARTFLFCSSMSAFGDVEDDVVDERTPVRNPDAYGMTKRLGEMMLAECGDALSSVSFRLPAVIGVGAARNWLAEALRRIVSGVPVEIFNPNATFNNAAHEDDLALLFQRLLDNSPSGHDTVVVGAAGSTTPLAAVQTMCEAANLDAEIIERPAAKKPFTIDSSRAMTTYGYDPTEISDMLDRYARESVASQTQY